MNYDKKTSVFVNLSRLYEDSESMMFYDILDHIVEICDDRQLDSILNTIQGNFNKWCTSSTKWHNTYCVFL